MYSVICCMKSKDSYNRLISQYSRDNIDWEQYIYDIDDVRSKISVSDYDFAVLDTRLYWYNEAVEFFDRLHIRIILFQGDFEETLDCLHELCPVIEDEKSEEELSLKQVPESSTFAETKIIEKEIKVEVPVYKSIYTGFANQLILIANLSSRAGSTFCTLNLAKLLSSLNVLTCVIEPPVSKPYIFDTVGLDKKIKANPDDMSLGFVSYPHLINESRKSVKEKEYIDDGIIWLVADSRKPLITDWDYYKMMKLIYAVKRAGVYLIDCGSNITHESIKPIISEADMIFVIVDPLPAECMQNESLLNEFLELKKSGIPIEFVINKFTSSVDKDDLLSYLRVNPIAFIPAIDTKYIHEAVYGCKIPFSLKQVEDVLLKPLYNISKLIVPSELLKNNTAFSGDYENKNTLFKNIRKIFGR